MSTNGQLVNLRNVVKTYSAGENNVTVLDGITLSVQAGEFVSIVGLLLQANPRCSTWSPVSTVRPAARCSSPGMPFTN